MSGSEVSALRSELFEARERFELYRETADACVREGEYERASCLAQLANACAVVASGLVQELVVVEGGSGS